MNTRLIYAALGLMLVAGGTAQAQERQRPGTLLERREALRARREAMITNRDALRERREAMRLRFESMPAEQRAFIQSLRAERGSIRDQVKSGAITRQEAREAFRAWIQANRPARPEQ